MSSEEMKKETETAEAKESEAVQEEPKADEAAEAEAVIKQKDTVIHELENQVKILKNEYAKAYADTENTKKRLQKEYDSLKKYHIQSFALEILPVLDNCERALAHETTDESYRKGVEMIYNQLSAALAREGVAEIEALNKPFDPNWHQAIMTAEEEGVEPGIVLAVLQKGYKLKDRLLRAAMVKVSA